MDNNQLKDFFNAMGATTEIWLIVYNSFRDSGMAEESAIEHTQAFMTAFMTSLLKNGKGEDK